MKIIKLKYLSRALPVMLLFMCFSCQEDFLTRFPKDKISTDDFWKTPSDLEIYVNQYYPTSFSDGGIWAAVFNQDQGTDNMLHLNYPPVLAGTRTVPSSGGGWGFGRIRSINFFFENYKTIEETDFNFDSYKQYIGEAHFFRAFFYFDLVKTFGDVPYYTKTLNMDSEDLYAARTPRQEVVDNIIADLDAAIEYMNSGPNGGGTRLNKEIAQLFKSRICLYEGTWEKYHDGTVFGVSNPKTDSYLTLAANAAMEVINSGHYSIYNTGNPESDYLNLFNQPDFSGNPEIMLWEQYSPSYGQEREHNHQAPLLDGGNVGFTKSLADSYLCIDGLPPALSSSYQGDNTLQEVMTNRDPRMNQTIWNIGDPIRINAQGEATRIFNKVVIRGATNMCPTGYQLKKGVQQYEEYYLGSEYRTNVGTPYIRYAEVLLNYAEAKAELGNITQSDIDMTINELRDRVEMPHLEINNIQNDPSWLFSDLSPIINEVRRERRVELAGEGFRWDDLARWRAHETFKGKRPLGAKYSAEEYPDIIVGEDVYLDEEGYFDIYQNSLPQGYGFDPNRDYLSPINTRELTLNDKLEQNPGWMEE